MAIEYFSEEFVGSRIEAINFLSQCVDRLRVSSRETFGFCFDMILLKGSADKLSFITV